MTLITYPSGSAGVEVATCAVATRAHCADDWTEQPNLHCTRLALCTGESISHGEFRWRFGYETVSAETRPVTSVYPNTYVRVQIAGTDGRDGYTWVGTWKSARKGDTVQTFTALGIESFLDQPCHDLPWDNAGDVAWAGRGLHFNPPFRGTLQNNRSADTLEVIPGLGLPNVYVFADDLTTAEPWSTITAVRMLLQAAAPKDATGDILWTWDPYDEGQLPEWDVITLPTHGRTWLSLLRSLVPRHRLMSFCVESDADGEQVFIRFFTFAESNISVYKPDGSYLGVILANDDQIQLDVSADQSGSNTLATQASHLADQVIVSGGRRQIVATLSKADDSADRAWTDAQMSAYLAGASGAADYPPYDDIRGREERDRDARHAEPLRPVYCRFGLPEAWDQQVWDGEAGTSADPPVEKVPLAVEADGTTQFTIPAPVLRLTSALPLQSGFDYSGSKIADMVGTPGYRGTKAAAKLDGQAFLPPLLCVRTHKKDVDVTGDVDRWVLGHLMARTADMEQQDGDVNRTWSTHVHMTPDLPTWEIRVQGEQQHVLAKNDFAARDDKVVGDVWWQTELLITVCFEDTRDVEARYPADDDVEPIGEQVQILRIEIPGCSLVDVRPNTVVGVEPTTGALIRTDGGALLDDRPYLQTVAQRAYEWHHKIRYALSLSTGWIDGSVKIGQLVTAVTDPSRTWPVNSVVTEITLEFPVANSATPPPPKCSIATAFAELDPQMGMHVGTIA